MDERFVKWSAVLLLLGVAVLTFSYTARINAISSMEIKGVNTVSDDSVETNEGYKESYVTPQEFIDEETGVHYFVFIRNGKAAVTVRYNADGTIMTDEKEEE